MDKSMRDLDKIREDYEFHLDSRQVKLLVLALSTICLLIFVVGFLAGRYFPRSVPSPEYASRITTPLSESGSGVADETASPGFTFDFFEELSDKDSGGKTEKPAQKTGVEAEEKASAPPVRTEPAQAPSHEASPGEAGGPEQGEGPALLVPSSVQAPKILPGQYTIQVGAFEAPDGAEKLSEDLKKKNYAAYVLEKTVPGKGTWHRVRVGRYAGRAEAERVAKILEEREGLTTFVTLYARN